MAPAETQPLKPVDVDVKVQDTRPGCWGLAYVEWLRVTGIFLVMWTLLGLFFWGLLQIGLTIRGDQYLTMDPRFFGDFGRDLVPVVEIKELGGGEEPTPVLANFFNRPDGCEGTFAEGSFVCSPEANFVWRLGPWVSSPAWTQVYADCAAAESTLINPSVKTASGVYTGYCLNNLPINAFVPAVMAQNYPTSGLV